MENIVPLSGTIACTACEIRPIIPPEPEATFPANDIFRVVPQRTGSNRAQAFSRHYSIKPEATKKMFVNLTPTKKIAGRSQAGKGN